MLVAVENFLRKIGFIDNFTIFLIIIYNSINLKNYTYTDQYIFCC